MREVLAIKNQGNLIYSYEELPYILEDKKLIINSLLAKPINGFSVNNVIDFNSREIPAYNSKLDTLVEDLNRFKYNGYKIILAVNSSDRCKKLQKEFTCL